MFTLQPIEEMKINQDKENLMMITETYYTKKIFFKYFVLFPESDIAQ